MTDPFTFDNSNRETRLDSIDIQVTERKALFTIRIRDDVALVPQIATSN